MMPITLRALQILGRQEWLRAGFRDRVIRLFADPDTCSSYEFTIDYFGLEYKGNLNSFIDWCIYFYGAYEKAGLMLVRDLLCGKTDPISIDIGANTGVYSIFMSKFGGEVHAFEPYKKAAESLKENISINGIRNVVVHEIAIGDKNCESKFYMPVSRNLGTASFLPFHATDANKIDKPLSIVNGDDYIASLKLKKIDFIKIDVEAYEKYVLRGLKNTLESYHPMVFMELSEPTLSDFQRSREFRSIFKHYRISRVVFDRSLFLFFNKPLYKILEHDVENPVGNLLCLPL
jgi:FkbM family methyltransferase